MSVMKRVKQVEQDTSVLISQFCIHHHTEVAYYGFIGNPTKIKLRDGKEKVECLPSTIEYGAWGYYGTFYAFSAMIKPVPSGLKQINAVESGEHPYATKSVEFAYDPFNIKDESISFLTWTQPINGTVPLYLHVSHSGYTFPSFDPKPPSTGEWTKSPISPIYVLVDPLTYPYPNNLPKWDRDENNEPIFKFKNVYNRCIPSQNGVGIEQCFLDTDKNILNNNIRAGPISLLSYLNDIQNKNPTSTTVLDIKLTVITAIMIGVVLTIVIVVVLLIV